jgi:hypothetical protein
MKARDTCAILLFAFILAAPLAAAQTTALPRLYIFTETSPDDSFLKEREQSVRDMRDVFASRKKVLTLADDEEHADVVVQVLERTTTIPKVRIGFSPPDPSMPGANMPARTVRLRVRATRGQEKIEFTNKNTPFENDRGWQAAADDVAKQIEKWVVGKTH